MCYKKDKHRGSALLTALALLITAASIVTLLITIQRVSIRRTETLQSVDQLYYSALGVEQWAMNQLITWQREKQLTHNWPVKMAATTLKQAQIQGQIEDSQGKFNLLNLKITTPKREHAEAMQKMLVSTLPNVSPEEARSLTEKIATPIRSFLPPKMLSELRTDNTITAERYQKLLPHIALLAANTKINLNSVTPALLRAYLPTLTEADAQTFISYRQENQGLQKVEDLKKIFPELTYPATIFSTTSEYYLVTSIATQDDYQLTLYTLMRIL